MSVTVSGTKATLLQGDARLSTMADSGACEVSDKVITRFITDVFMSPHDPVSTLEADLTGNTSFATEGISEATAEAALMTSSLTPRHRPWDSRRLGGIGVTVRRGNSWSFPLGSPQSRTVP